MLSKRYESTEVDRRTLLSSPTANVTKWSKAPALKAKVACSIPSVDIYFDFDVLACF